MTVFILRILIVLLFLMNARGVTASQSAQLLFEKANQASNNGDYLQALDKWDQLLEFFPDDAVALSNRGNVRFALGDFQGAIVDQTNSIDLLPNEVDSHLNRGIAEEALQLWEEAANDYNWILEHNSEDASALYNLGKVRAAQSNWIQAADLFQQASFLRSGFVMARSNKALMIYQLGDFDEAESELRSIIRKYPMVADSRAALSALLWNKGCFGEAESHWAAAVGLDSRYKEQDWLSQIRRWPPKPTKDLFEFLILERS